jgi:hypothetical protein
MKYTVKSLRQDGETLFTTVEYKITVNQLPNVFTVEVAHFAPKDTAEIVTNIQNRGITEKQKIKTTLKNATLKSDLNAALNQEVTYNEP